MAGTSQATPMVAGVVALLQSAAWKFGGELLSPEQVRDFLQQNADPVVDAGANTNVQQTGVTFPRIDAYKAVQAVRQYELRGRARWRWRWRHSQGRPQRFDRSAVNVPALTGNLLPIPIIPASTSPTSSP